MIMIQFGMNNRKILIKLFLLFLLFGCNGKEKPKNLHEKEPELKLTFFYENGKDTVSYGQQVDLAIKIEDNKFDSLSLFIGNVNDGKLIDTIGVIPVKNNIAFFIFVPNKLGKNIIEGVLKEYKVENDKTIVKSTPFETTYYCIK